MAWTEAARAAAKATRSMKVKNAVRKPNNGGGVPIFKKVGAKSGLLKTRGLSKSQIKAATRQLALAGYHPAK